MAELNITIDDDLKIQAENIFNNLGFSMSSAINIFLRAAVREKKFPTNFEIYIPNETTEKTIEEGRRIAEDKNIKGYKSISELKAALENEI